MIPAEKLARVDALMLQEWLDVLGAITYYELLRAPSSAAHDELHAAFLRFAETWHPDVHRWRPASEQEAIGRIYRRGVEAWRVLSVPTLRERYDDAVRRGVSRPEDVVVDMDRPGSLAPAAKTERLIDTVRAPSARPFVLRAEELLKKGDPKQAKIQLVMALHLDKGNAALEAFGRQLDEAIAASHGSGPKR